MSCFRQWWSTIVSNIKFERVSPLQVKIEDLGLVYQVMECKALWVKIVRIWGNVAYRGPVFVIVSIYDRLGPYFSLYYPFWAVLAHSVRYDHVKIKVPSKRESSQKWPIIIQNVVSYRGVTNCGHIWHSIANSDQFSTSAPEKATNDLWRQLVAYTAYYGIYSSRMTCFGKLWPSMVKNVKFDRVSALQGRIEGPRSSTSGYSMYGTLIQDLSN